MAYGEALRLKGDFAECWESIGSLLLLKPDWEGARSAFERAMELNPRNAEVFSKLAFTRQMLCDWRSRDSDLARLLEVMPIETSKRAKPYAGHSVLCALTLPWSAAQLRAVAASHGNAIAERAARAENVPDGLNIETARASVPAAAPAGDGRLRIAYLSCEFRDHAVSHFMQCVIGRHDRAKFEVFGYSFGPDDGSIYRKRIESDCDHFRDLRTVSSTESYRQIRNDRIDILIDLQGYTGFSRMSLMAQRPAKIQVNYLGYAFPTAHHQRPISLIT